MTLIFMVLGVSHFDHSSSLHHANFRQVYRTTKAIYGTTNADARVGIKKFTKKTMPGDGPLMPGDGPIMPGDGPIMPGDGPIMV